MRNASPTVIAAFLAALVFTLATAVESEFHGLSATESSDGAFTKMLGDGRRLFSGQSVEMADVYLHSGFYPSIFDERKSKAEKAIQGNTDEHGDQDHVSEDHSAHTHDEHGNCTHEEGQDDEHEKAMSFMGEPRDWIDALTRNFRVTQHSHLEAEEQKEILPWLKLAIELDPQAIETYTSTAYWLRKELKRVEDARDILREGIRNNPKSYALLYEMGNLYRQDDKNDVKARNIWLAALRFWREQSADDKVETLNWLGKITVSLARLEVDAGNVSQAIQYFELAKTTSPNPAAIQKQIDALKVKSGTSNPTLIPSAPR